MPVHVRRRHRRHSDGSRTARSSLTVRRGSRSRGLEEAPAAASHTDPGTPSRLSISLSHHRRLDGDAVREDVARGGGPCDRLPSPPVAAAPRDARARGGAHIYWSYVEN
ncbi:hypothetical protein GUJ93_ZPchr0012g20949 [Zizania palustris]|uniref:Uncharacterized protein n=1 Tax=Zizania palustris TaxID=103762 RepID=A0A8J6BRV2_ZIZPA|nr:hypothetical protein GUJ93_ZPchr0012g20949 [Zizania palustris]